MHLLSHQMINELQGNLREYGLNPNEWYLESQKTSPHQSENIIEVKSKENGNVVLRGAALIKSIKGKLRAYWKSLAIAD